MRADDLLELRLVNINVAGLYGKIMRSVDIYSINFEQDLHLHRMSADFLIHLMAALMICTGRRIWPWGNLLQISRRSLKTFSIQTMAITRT